MVGTSRATLALGVFLATISCSINAFVAGSDVTAGRDPSAEGGIEVIVAGLGRTGTFSLAAALDVLGYSTYHYVQLSHSAQWADWASGLKSDDDMIDLIVESGYNATLDNPAADMYDRLGERYPQSKVVLTIRDSPTKWARSWMALFDTMEVTERPFSFTFPSPFQFVPLFKHLKAMRCKMGTHLGLEPCELTRGWRDKADSRKWLVTQYEAHNLQVMNTVPADRLLLLNVKEGWEPLCSFLGKDVPRDAETGEKIPFPNASEGVNDMESLRRLKIGFTVVVYGWIPSIFLVMTASLMCAKALSGRKASSPKDKKD